MTKTSSRFTGMLVLIAGALLCVPQVAQASVVHSAPQRWGGYPPVRADWYNTTTTVPHHVTTTTMVHDVTTTTGPHQVTTTTVPNQVTTTTTTVVHRVTTTTAVSVVLIPPIVVFPTVTTTIDPPPRALPIVIESADRPAAIVPAAAAQGVVGTLPVTGSTHVGVIALAGAGLIALGLLIRRKPAR